MEFYNDFARLEISLGACANNYNYYRSLLKPSTKLLVLVKANAYGHGGVEFARILEKSGVDYLAVAQAAEGIRLRKAGINVPILVLSGATDHYDEMIDYDLEPSIPSVGALKELVSVIRRRSLDPVGIHIKLDTGMHRLGFMTGEIDELTEALGQYGDDVHVLSIYSHLATADDLSADEFTLAQIRMFSANAGRISCVLGYKPMYHILNSAGIERFPQYQFDMVRLGIGIYGVSPLGTDNLRSAAAFKCKLMQIKHLTAEDGAIGYCRNGKIPADGCTIATIPVGYADGIDRRLGNGNYSFLLNGHLVPTIGNICMDMCMVDISGVEASVGDTVTIFGEQGVSAERMAQILGTIPYEVFTSVPVRVRRVLVD